MPRRKGKTQYRSKVNDSFGIGQSPVFSLKPGEVYQDGDFDDDVLDILLDSGALVEEDATE